MSEYTQYVVNLKSLKQRLPMPESNTDGLTDNRNILIARLGNEN